MGSTEWVGLLGLVVAVLTFVGGMLRGWKQKTVAEAEREQRQADAHEEAKKEIRGIKSELVEVKKKLDEHNGYAEKFAQTSIDVAGIKKDIEWIKEKLK